MRTLGIAVGLVAAGFAALALAARGASASGIVVTQVSYVASGGLGGIALVAVGLRLVRIVAARLEHEAECAAFDALIVQAQRSGPGEDS